MCDKIVQFLSTVSSFLYIMIRHKIDFCNNEPRFMPLIICHLNCIILLMLKINSKQFLFYSWKIRSEGRIPLRQRFRARTSDYFRVLHCDTGELQLYLTSWGIHRCSRGEPGSPCRSVPHHRTSARSPHWRRSH